MPRHFHQPLLTATLLVATTIACTADSRIIADINTTAMLLAGKESPKASTRITKSHAWQEHREAMQKAWAKYKASTLDPMLSWSSGKNGPDLPPGGVVRYAFSGPDVLHVMRMFPRADSYMLCGLEPIGTLPRSTSLRGKLAESALAEIRKILEESIRYSFFRTSDMQKELPAATYAGTLPIMCLFLAADGHKIKDVEFISLGKDGKLTGLGTSHKGAAAVRIDVHCRDGRTRHILYFQTNIANGALKRSGFLTYLESLPPGPSYVKASSYLMHEPYFSQIRDHLLASSNAIIQDDSGIPLRFFDRSLWNLTPYGNHETPTDLFKRYHQDDLVKIFRSKAKPLPFGTGYRWRKGQSNLLLAIRGSKSPVRRAITTIGRILPGKGNRSTKPKPIAEKKPVNQPPKPSETPRPAIAATPLSITLKLVTTSNLNNDQVTDLQNAFIVNEYEILAVHGQQQHSHGKRIRIVKTCLFHGRRLPQSPLGSIISLRVVPLSTYPNLMSWHIEDDLPKKKAVKLYIASQTEAP